MIRPRGASSTSAPMLTAERLTFWQAKEPERGSRKL
jgi:hypothetical protein